ncbi:hypothetical protein [Aliidiomarina indica]|uniref:hypothetical protein n=1 Tax=Aliidiomarina indica TaxID=2749147 RepID=UPI0018909B54|nr:hypothetical protein [Aliidiomarina indica]
MNFYERPDHAKMSPKRIPFFKLSALTIVGAALLLPWWQHGEEPLLDEGVETQAYSRVLIHAHEACLFDVHVLGAESLEERLSTRLQFVQENFNPEILPFCATLDPQRYESQCFEVNGHVHCENVSSEPPEAIAMVVTGDGLAQTRNGVVYAPQAATGLLLQHELGHALGLADEYGMRPELARAFCSGDYQFDALNIVFTASRELNDESYQAFKASLPWRTYLTTPIARKTEKGQWVLGSDADSDDAVGLYPADTCTHGPGYAWKPVAEKTFMEQHEIGSVPTLYLKLIRDRLNSQ